MKLGLGTKRLTNRKRATPAPTRGTPVLPQVLPADLPTPVFGMNPDLQKEFAAASADDAYPVRITRREKDILSTKSIQQRKRLPVLEVTDISYTIMSHEELETIAVYEVKKDSDNEIDTVHGVNDPRGGTVDHNSTCVTCQKDNLECPGHFGMIRLNEHIIHPLFRREVVDILTSICGSCGGLLVPVETIRDKGILALEGSKRLREIAELSKNVGCRRRVKEEEEEIMPCIANPIYKTDKLKETGKIFYTRDPKSKTADNIRTIEEIEEIFNSITDEEAEILGFSKNAHPRRFIMKSLAVIPLCARAPVIQDGQIMKDDLTSMYQDIVRVNNELAKQDLKESDREKKIKSLIFSIEHFINNADQKYRQGKKKAYQALKDRIQGKDALIRNALMGKRVNFSARTVIGPDPSLKFGQIRVPRAMAPYLTQHKIVTPENLEKMTSLLRTGKITHIIPSQGRLEGKRIKVNEKIQKEHTLVIGDEVDRWLMNGDYVAYNRQPTLQKQGIMGYEVVLGDPLTIGLHLGYTKQHNAD